MLDLKSKLLAAGLVTAEQVAKVEAEESARKAKKDERERRPDGPHRDGPHRDGPHRDGHARDGQRREGQRRDGPPRDGPPRDGPRREGPSGGGPGAPGAAPRGRPGPGPRGNGPPREARPPRDAGEQRPPREPREDKRASAEDERKRWEKRLTDLKAAPKSEQYEVIRGWVVRNRLDDQKTITETAERFHFGKSDGSIGWVSVEPELRARLAAGKAGVIGYMGFNGLEHAVVPDDLARDIASAKPEWLRTLAGVTDVDPPPGSGAVEGAVEGERPAAEAAPTVEGTEGVATTPETAHEPASDAPAEVPAEATTEVQGAPVLESMAESKGDAETPPTEPLEASEGANDSAGH